jgi:hypothetical protein
MTSSSSLISILRESATIWTRSFTLVYVYFLFSLVTLFVIQGPSDSLGSADALAFLLLGLLGLIFSAFMAGLYYMAGNVCRRYLQPDIGDSWGQPSKRLKAVSFSIFKDFLPGIGRYFMPMVLGYAVQVACLAALLWSLNPLWLRAVVILRPVMDKMLQHHREMITSQQLMAALSASQKNTLIDLFMGFLMVLLGYGLFWLLTCLWPIMLLWYTGNPLRAYWLSLRQFFRDPLRLLSIGVCYSVLAVLLSFVMMLDGLFLALFARLGFLLLSIGLTITLFVYAWRVIGPPTVDEDKDEEPSPIAPPTDDSSSPLS